MAELRIVAGAWRGRRIRVPTSGRVRPTADRVREAWMSIVQPALDGAEVLDLCAGSGALGLEALSRGAAHATFVERDPRVLSTLRENIAALGAEASATVLRAEAGRFLAGLDRPDEGEIEVAGARIDRMTEDELTLHRRRRVGVVFQQYNLLPTPTALENVMLPGILDGGDRAALEGRARGLLGTLGLAERATHRPEAMSGGEQQRVAIARALLFEPPVLFADEPTGALDSANSERMWRMLDELARERRMVVLMVTHEPAAAAHCRHVFVIRDGVVAGGFETKGMNASDLVVRASGLAGAAR